MYSLIIYLIRETSGGALAMLMMAVLGAFIVLQFLALLHCLRNRLLNDAERIISVLLLLFGGIIGLALYYLVYMRGRSTGDEPGDSILDIDGTSVGRDRA